MQPISPPRKTISGSRLWCEPSASFSSSMGIGEYASIRRYPALCALSAASTSCFGSSNSAIRP